MTTKIIKACLFVLILSSPIALMGQDKNKELFSSYMNTMETTNNETNRLNIAINFFSDTFISTAQLRNALNYIYGDRNKFRVCITAYPNIIDKENFFLIYDSFTRMSWAIRLYHFTESNQEFTQIEPVCVTNPNEFDYIKSSIVDQTFSNKQLSMAKQHISQQCLSIEQMKDLCRIFNMDNDKLTLIKFMFSYTNQPERFYEFKELLNFKSTQRELDLFLVDRN